MKKYLFISIAVILFCCGCHHKMEGWYVKAQDGKVYRLKSNACNEGYNLEEIDTASLKKVYP